MFISFHSSGVESCLKLGGELFKLSGHILYGEKLHPNGVTIKIGRVPAFLAPPLFCHLCFTVLLITKAMAIITNDFDIARKFTKAQSIYMNHAKCD